jgi:lipoteichoic acid synthase
MVTKGQTLLQTHFVVISLLLVLKIFLVRIFLFNDYNILHTITLELSYIVLFSAAFEYMKNKAKILFYFLINITFSTLFVSILVYYNYFGRIVTYHALGQIGQVGAVRESIMELIKPVYIVFYSDIIVLFLLFLLKKYPLKVSVPFSKKFLKPVLALSLALSFGNFMLHKDAFISNTVAAAEDKGLLNYQILEFYSGAENAKSLADILTERELQEEIYRLKGIESLSPAQRKYFGTAEGYHLVVVQFEAMQQFPINLEIDGKEVTPFMNNLMKESFYFPNVYQQVAGGNTSDAEFIFNTSLFPDANTPTSEKYGKKDIPSLPKLLKEKGYTSLTFHADEVEFWNRDELYPALGFDTYYDETFLGDEDLIGFGVSDEILFKKAVDVMAEKDAQGEIVYSHLIGVTSHHPFKIPESKNVIDLPTRFENTLVGNYIRSMSYSDLALQSLVNDLKEKGLWEKTVLLIYGDHFGLQDSTMSEEDKKLASELVGHEYNLLDRFNIPLLITVPGKTNGQVFETVGGQLDMMPTAANLLGVSLNNYIHFGQDLVNNEENLIGARYYLPVGSFINDDIFFKPEKGFEDGNAYERKTYKPISDFANYKANYERIIKLQSLSDAYLQSLPAR